MKPALVFSVVSLCAGIAACSTLPTGLDPISTVSHVDLPRFMGTWYPIAVIPTPPEKNAINPTEQYRLDEDGSIPTVFTYHDGSPEGAIKQFNSKAFVVNHETNAEWGVQFFRLLPIKAEYLIAWLADDYSEVIVARNKRDYVWYMSRSPQPSEEQLSAAKKRIAALGYDMSQLRIVRVNTSNNDTTSLK